MWEQKLFCKLLDAIKARNLTLEKTFELLDTDNSGTVTPSELKIGLK
jgi:Ca2+-binding EF-hand superfamily protein